MYVSISTFVLGFVLGYIVFERPQWATNLFDRAKAWVKRKLNFGGF